MEPIHITSQDIEAAKKPKIVLSWKDILQPTLIENQADLRSFWIANVPIVVKAHPRSQLSVSVNGTELAQSVCPESGRLIFENISWVPGLNDIRIINHTYDADSCQATLSANFVPHTAPYYGLVDPITRITFRETVNPNDIVRCLSCGRYQLMDSWQVRRRCSFCRASVGFSQAGDRRFEE